jgi:CheY-like chemotaxis protein
MSLLGRLEDLSLTDIIQIVFLSRRTGVLEVLDERGRHTVLFRKGLVVDAASPNTPDLESVDAEAIRNRIMEVIAPLLHSRVGQFNFLLSDDLGVDETGFEGFPPQRILAIEGDKLKPLQALQDSMEAGKELLRRDMPAAESALRSEPDSHFRVAGGLIEIESPEASYRNVVLFERDPLIRVAAKRAFSAGGAKIAQFGALDSVRETMADFFRTTAFFLSFLEVTDESVALLQHIKRKNPKLPVVMIDAEVDLRRRHALLEAGADLYLTKPSPARLRPEIAEEELKLFAESLALFADGAFAQFEEMAGIHGSEAGPRFYEEGRKEQIDRSFHLLKRFIDELSNPNDIREVADTILRLSAEYFDRGMLFLVSGDSFVGLGGFGGGELDVRARALRISRAEPSILDDVATSGEAHRGKIRRTEANQQLIETLDDPIPTEVAALPIMHGGRTIGILYGDNAEHRGPIDSMTGLEIFLSQAGYAFGTAHMKAEGRGQKAEG